LNDKFGPFATAAQRAGCRHSQRQRKIAPDLHKLTFVTGAGIDFLVESVLRLAQYCPDDRTHVEMAVRRRGKTFCARLPFYPAL
jgi:hypothetical protein